MMDTEPTAPLPMLSEGYRLAGKFVLGREIGRGSFGTVHEAVDEILDRKIAIKVFDTKGFGAGEEGARFDRRFMREARAVAKLSHPNIIAIHEVGRDGHLAFIAMELVSGSSLRRILTEKHRLRFHEALPIASQLLSALHYSHGEGILHRDIKPENVLLRDDGILKVADFGLAKLLHSDTSTLSRDGSVTGTPSYMSPEQVRGEELDARSDQFSAAALLYELLSGIKPFAAETVAATVYRILEAEPTKLTEVGPGIPAEVEWTIARALSKTRDARFPDCGTFCAALASEETPTRDVPTPTKGLVRTQPLPRRGNPKTKKLLLGAALVLAPALLALLFFMRSSPKVAPPDRSLLNPNRTFDKGQIAVLQELAKTREEYRKVLDQLAARDSRELPSSPPATAKETVDPLDDLLEKAVRAFGYADVESLMDLCYQDVSLQAGAGLAFSSEGVREGLKTALAADTPVSEARILGSVDRSQPEISAVILLRQSPKSGFPGASGYRLRVAMRGKETAITRIEELDREKVLPLLMASADFQESLANPDKRLSWPATIPENAQFEQPLLWPRLEDKGSVAAFATASGPGDGRKRYRLTLTLDPKTVRFVLQTVSYLGQAPPQKVDAIIDSWMDDLRQGRLESVLARFRSDARVQLPDETLTGVDSIREGFFKNPKMPPWYFRRVRGEFPSILLSDSEALLQISAPWRIARRQPDTIKFTRRNYEITFTMNGTRWGVAVIRQL